MPSLKEPRLLVRVFTLALAVGCMALLTSLFHASAQRISPLEGDPNDYYCPAYFHSCASSGFEGYFAPDPFDVGAACDDQFVGYVATGSEYDRDQNGVDDRSCYGSCDLTYNTTGTVDDSCYANCQSGSDGMGGYAGCLRGAFGITRPATRTENPRHLPNISGNIYRSCLVGQVPQLYADEYNACIANGGTVQECCSLVSSHFP